MTLKELIAMTRLYTRDSNDQMFKNIIITAFLNQAIDRITQYKVFEGMAKFVNEGDVTTLLPLQYHYMLALFAASRCYDMDERFYEGTEKRNEFEQLLETLIGEIQAGNITVTDGLGNAVEDGTNVTDYVRDVYFKKGDEDATIL